MNYITIMSEKFYVKIWRNKIKGKRFHHSKQTEEESWDLTEQEMGKGRNPKKSLVWADWEGLLSLVSSTEKSMDVYQTHPFRDPHTNKFLKRSICLSLLFPSFLPFCIHTRSWGKTLKDLKGWLVMRVEKRKVEGRKEGGMGETTEKVIMSREAAFVWGNDKRES